MIRVCLKCGAKNRIPAKHLADVGKCGSCKAALPAEAGPIEADPELFEEVLRDAKVPVLVDFWAEWCGPCKMIAPALEEISDELAGQVDIVKIDIMENTRVPGDIGVQSIPLLVLFKDGKPVAQKLGAAPKSQLKSWIESVL
jgi:thioredoxin 1